ncbi:hypothetical protein COLINT_03127 [Collinsella intestinalis DSM 13280]|uniref:Uncharacterized protein n=1 Tax=Collinsella intestinalis DSM 13280 TaxID=521003 RepID=C4FAN2_9ACTN|nr:hypothetical protein COLINT_03127 [Collinsella intestinalis DSM 13280]
MLLMKRRGEILGSALHCPFSGRVKDACPCSMRSGSVVRLYCLRCANRIVCIVGKGYMEA